MPDLTPQQFVEKWERADLKERASYQEHFMDLCHLVGHPTPADEDPAGKFFTFEAGVKKTGGGQGFADVWYKDHFAIEYKGKGKYNTLGDAYRQLLRYRENLDNPPLLIVCDIEHWEIHTNFTGTAKRVYAFTNAQIAGSTRLQRILYNLFYAPYELHPDRTAADVTADAANVFKEIADNMRAWDAAPDRIAHFLTKLVFCLFAEDVGLLPAGLSGRGLFTEIIEQTRPKPSDFVYYTEQLFKAMADGGKVMFRDVRFFDGSLFDDVTVEALSAEALAALEKACLLDWSSIEPAIFGTLFERSLDPSKRAQLGAHYTSRDDILLIVEPVLMQPLRREWDAIQQEAAPVRAEYDTADSERKRHNIRQELADYREQMLSLLRAVTVLDPACGSGNFLYVALQLVKDLEKEVVHSPLFQGVGLTVPFPEVHPRQLFGIEINPIAHDLASIVTWIGYIQWQQNNGYLSFKEPILEPLDNIWQMDAILAFDDDGNPVEPEWPSVDVIVSNPPFLGDKKMRAELGDEYVDRLRKLFEDRIPGQSDLVCYWFEKARESLETGKVGRVGLLATNSIRQTKNRTVLERIKTTGNLFMGWSDREWILEGAAVRVSMVGFDDGTEQERFLDGQRVNQINSDLTANVDVTIASTLLENEGLCFLGMTKSGPFDIDGKTAREMLSQSTNPNKRPNSDVVKIRIAGQDITRGVRDIWVIDFNEMPLEEAMLYEAPFAYVEKHVKPIRETNREARQREKWWLFSRSRPALRNAIATFDRFVVTPEVAKHRVFIWVGKDIIPDHKLHVVARDDDYFFGVLHSHIHEIWSLAQGSWLGVGNDPSYSSSRTFETFPFPWPPGQEPTDHPAYIAISVAAQQLHEERDAWLNPPGTPERALRDRTLTNLYNALAVFRGDPLPEGKKHPRTVTAAGDFAPRLAELHEALDCAVCDGYGWDHAVLEDDEEILQRLLTLNLERAKREHSERD